MKNKNEYIMELRFYFKIQWGTSKLATVNVTAQGLGKLAMDVAEWCLETAKVGKPAEPELVILTPDDELYEYTTVEDYTGEGGFLVW